MEFTVESQVQHYVRLLTGVQSAAQQHSFFDPSFCQGGQVQTTMQFGDLSGTLKVGSHDDAIREEVICAYEGKRHRNMELPNNV